MARHVETAWVIETALRSNDPTAARYLSAHNGKLVWTEDDGKALRFVRASDAHGVAMTLGDAVPTAVCEHQWIAR